MTMETKADNTTDFTPDSEKTLGVTNLAEAIAVRDAALEAEFSAKTVQSAANDSLRRLIAGRLGIPPRQIEIAAGASARVKRLLILGDARALDAALSRLAKAKA